MKLVGASPITAAGERSLPRALLTQMEKLLPPILISDENGEIYWAALGVQQLLGYGAAELQGKNISDFAAPHEIQSLLKSVRASSGNPGELFSLELQLRCGDRVWRNVEARGLYTKKGELGGCLVFTFHDITAHRQAERELQQRNRELALLNRAGQILGATLEMDEVFAVVLEEVRRLMNVVACSIWLIEPETQEIVCQQAVGPRTGVIRGWRLPIGTGFVGTVARTGKSLNVPNVLADERHFEEVDKKTGLQLRSILSVPLATQDKVMGVLQAVDVGIDRFTASDVTLLDALCTSAAIAIDNARLVNTLRQRTEELQQSNQELESFAYTVAHDLKAPLTHVIGYAEVLEFQGKELWNSEQLDYLRVIRHGGRKMDNIIDELLLLARLRKGEIQCVPVDMLACVTVAVERLTPLVEKYQAQVELPEHCPRVYGYAPWLEEVWMNYLSNAIKYGGRPPQLEIGVEPRSNGAVDFWVRDNGAGFSAEQQKQLFIPFSRLSGADTGGYGLGLSIVQRIVTKLNGEVWAKSEEGQGSIFGLTLPGV
ncbi:MAG TPA: GAF domain-containing protein [Thermoflexia bacterium]|nr:GAF domain-containing protein [Thermoflexia bacterium]